MLVLSRRRDTAIQIGCDIKVTVLSIRSRRVKLGIEAPKQIPIDREEVYAKKIERLMNRRIK